MIVEVFVFLSLQRGGIGRHAELWVVEGNNEQSNSNRQDGRL